MAHYHEDIVSIELENGMIHRSFLRHSIGRADVDANRFGIRAYRNGIPVDLSGASCQGFFRNAEGLNIALTSYGTVDGNVAYVTLPAACYNVEGLFTLSIKIVGGGVTSTMRIVDGMVDNTNTSGAVAPTSSVPTYSEIIAQYDAMVAATSAANTAIAETFDATKAYPAGKYVINSGAPYRLTEDHAENTTWANTSKVEVKFGNELSDVKSAIGDISELTRNLNTSQMGYYGNAADGYIYVRDNKFFGMRDFIPVTAGEKLTFSFGGMTSSSAISWTYLFVNDSGINISRAGYQNLNTRTITVPTGATKLNAFCRSDSTITLATDAHIQIEKGEVHSDYIPGVSAADYILREKERTKTMVLMDRVGAMLETAKGYFEQAYGFAVGGESSLTYQNGRGMFHLNVLDDDNNPTIVCSEFVTALMKGIKYSQSRYVLSENHIAQWGWTSDGIEEPYEDGQPYDISYYNYNYSYVTIDEDDKPSYDYMVASQMYRYAKNHGWAYPISSTYQQIRPGDIVFNVDENSPMYKHITHCAIVINVGYDDGRCVVLESNDYDYDEHPVGVLLRNAAISSFAYGARFPVYDAPSITKAIFKETGITIATTSAYSFWSRTGTNYLPAGFYTMVAHGSISENLVQATVKYNDETTSRFFRMVKSNDTYSVTFYALKPFNYITIGCTAGASIYLNDIELYNGYICADNGLFGFDE